MKTPTDVQLLWSGIVCAEMLTAEDGEHCEQSESLSSSKQAWTLLHRSRYNTVTCLYSLHVYNTLMRGLLALLPLLKIKREDIREYRKRKVLFQKITKILVKMLRYWSRKIYCLTKNTRHKWVITSHCSCLHTGFFDELKPDLVWEHRTKNFRDWHKEIWV